MATARGAHATRYPPFCAAFAAGWQGRQEAPERVIWVGRVMAPAAATVLAWARVTRSAGLLSDLVSWDELAATARVVVLLALG